MVLGVVVAAGVPQGDAFAPSADGTPNAPAGLAPKGDETKGDATAGAGALANG